jgi:hypothetical protein
MAESIYSYALTTVARVKTRLTIDNTGFDTLLLYIINSVTDLIEGECNRRFIETLYTNEVYSIPNAGNGFLVLRQAPVSSVTSVQFRAGLKSNPNWTDFVTDTWDIMEDGAPGIIQIYGAFIQGLNSVRVTYTAGYKINFENYGDNATHTLPADVSDLAERMVVKLFKRREAEGKQREDFNGGTIIWKEILSPEDEMTLAKYRRVNFF